jgi:hypothetical protein
VARAASLDSTVWLPAYGWWPHPDEFDATVLLTPYHHAVEQGARYSFVLRGYLGSHEPVWEHDVGNLVYGQDRGVRLRDLDIPTPPTEGGILEVHGIRHDKEPKKGVGFIGMWIDAQTPDGGGYLIPTIPIRGQAKAIQRDDLQVVPGITVSATEDTELVLLNPVDERTEVVLTANSIDGLQAQSPTRIVEPFSVWRGSLRHTIPRVRRLLEPGGGVGSLTIQSSHRLLPYFGHRLDGGPLLSLDHTAPIFA